VILDVFSELQRAGPLDPGRERQVYLDAFEEARLADRLGYGCWWTVEHHGATEFSYSSVPELVLISLAHQTQRIRLGHSGVLAPFRINHPLRVAERAAYLDVISGGRLELGLARSGGTEWDAFGVDAGSSREQLREALRMIPRMWTQPSFAWKSDLIEIPERAVLPRPVQEPHPPLWQTCTSPESFEMAGELGVGVLATTLCTPLASLRALFEHYARGLRRAEPAGRFKNDQRAVFTFMHCAETRQQAIASRAAESVLWFLNAAPRVFQVPRSLWIDAIRGDLAPGDPHASARVEAGQVVTDLDPGDPVPVIRLLNRQLLGERIDPVEAFEVLEQLESVVIGDVAACRAKARAYAELGVDRLMCLMSFGWIAQADVLRSLRLVAAALMPGEET
jgi:alkanesulfonate monooxygenase SsuD/methylene tetrahydromethanopterin reductase-like flavin-dependent oxidoreductase (luciferase family)